MRDLRIIVIALAVGVAGALAPGCYADWAFVRHARNKVEPAMQQQIKALSEENAALKARLGPEAPK